MSNRIFGLALAMLSSSFLLLAQDDADVLFTVDDRPVTVGEFRYIYSKTNGQEADFSRESVMEYLDLYERFKLKVARARAMGLDTVVALQNELEGYRRQLADNYLVDREVTDDLVQQLHRRKQADLDFSHILLSLPSADPADTAAVYRRALELGAETTAENFADRARAYSADTYSKDRGGRIGFVSAPFPRGMHRLEEALYEAPTDEVVGPVRSPAGYHLLLKHAERPAYGEVEIAHILFRKDESGGSRQRAEAALVELREGNPFEEVAAAYSEDDKTSNQGGYIGFFGINRYNKDFEEVAFALERDGAISGVIESPAGYHILKRISRRGVQPLDEQRPLLEAAVKQDPRYAEARKALMERLEKEYGTTVMEDNFSAYRSALDSSFFDPGKRFAPADRPSALLRIGERELTEDDFNDYLARNARLRASLQRRYDAGGAAEALLESWVDEQVQAYAEDQLENKFPEFKALMREYREGILLFEATKLEVWDKAGEDSLGLQAFFEQHRDDYRFGPRARVLEYRIPTDAGVAAADVMEYARDHDKAAVQAQFGTAVSISEDRFEADRLPAGLQMEEGSSTSMTAREEGDVVSFSIVAAIEPGRRKELSEARGYVIADYQDQLEKEWVAALRKEFTVKRNKKVLAKLIES